MLRTRSYTGGGGAWGGSALKGKYLLQSLQSQYSIWLEFKLVRDFMPVQIIWKSHKDPI